jgi:hypothetical protein
MVPMYYCILTPTRSIPDIYLVYQSYLRDHTNEVSFDKFLRFLLAKLIRASDFDTIDDKLKELIKIAVNVCNGDQNIIVGAQDTVAFCKGKGILMMNELQELLVE